MNQVKFVKIFPLTPKNERDKLSSEINLLGKERTPMAKFHTNIQNLTCIVDFSGGVAVDSRSAPISR